MQPTLRPARRYGNVRTSELLCELSTRTHAELRVDVGEMTSHRPLAEEEGHSDLPIRSTLDDQGGHTPLGCSQPLLTLPAADVPELRPRPGRPARSADGLEPFERGRNGFTGRALL